MAPLKLDLELYQGNDWAAVVRVADASGPADLSGFSAHAQIRRRPAYSDPEVAAEIIAQIPEATPDLILLTISRDETEDLQGHYVWDLIFTAQDGTTTTVYAGNVEVTPRVTRIGVAG